MILFFSLSEQLDSDIEVLKEAKNLNEALKKLEIDPSNMMSLPLVINTKKGNGKKSIKVIIEKHFC